MIYIIHYKLLFRVEPRAESYDVYIYIYALYTSLL